MSDKPKQDQVRRPVSAEVGMDRPGSVDIFLQLSEPMPKASLSVDEGRGFPLTSIKAAFILERLNQVFGLLGYGWRYVVSPHHLESAGGKEEVLVEVALQWRMTTEVDADGFCPPLYWHKTTDPQTGVVFEGWQYLAEVMSSIWSEPIFATGGSSAQRSGSVPLTDAYRASVTNAITKIASRMGVGLEVFKGQDDLIGKSGTGKRKPRKPRAKKDTSTSSKAKGPAKANATATNPGFSDLDAIQATVKAEMARLTFEDGEPDPKTVQALAHKMSALGLKMQTTRLVHCLLGKGGYTQKGVMGTYNFLLRGQLSTDNIELLNTMAFPAGKEAAKENAVSPT